MVLTPLSILFVVSMRFGMGGEKGANGGRQLPLGLRNHISVQAFV